MKIKIGDIVKLKSNTYHESLIGLVVAAGEEQRRMYGDGIGYHEYVDVKWFNKKYKNIARYSGSVLCLDIVSKGDNHELQR